MYLGHPAQRDLGIFSVNKVILVSKEADKMADDFLVVEEFQGGSVLLQRVGGAVWVAGDCGRLDKVIWGGVLYLAISGRISDERQRHAVTGSSSLVNHLFFASLEAFGWSIGRVDMA
jgi:hypothetical protein